MLGISATPTGRKVLLPVLNVPFEELPASVVTPPPVITPPAPSLDTLHVAFRSTATTGAMAAGSNSLTVSSVQGFAVNDYVIVAVGGEAGQGQRGTVGVGGVWAATNNDPALYYTNTDAPKALHGKITAIAGNVLTIDTAATAATIGAGVYLDNTPIWKALPYYKGMSNKVIQIPAGKFAGWGFIQILECSGFFFQGMGADATTLFSPPGAMQFCFLPGTCQNATFSDYHVHGNFRLNGYGFSDPVDNIYGHGTLLSNGVNCIIKNVKATDVSQQAVALSRSTGTKVYNCSCTMTGPLARYIQWLFQTADGDFNEFYDCTVDAPYLMKSFETFRSSDDKFVRCGGRNVMFSANTAQAFEFLDCWSDITANSQYSELSISHLEPVFNINANIGPGAELPRGGVLSSIRLVQSGYVNADKDSLKAILINAGNSNIRIAGGYIEAPDYGGAKDTYGPHVGSTGPGTVIDGLTVVGKANPFWGNIKVQPDATVINCTADKIIGP